MSLTTTPLARTCAAVALAFVGAESSVAHAADQSLTGAVIGAFETIVIDTTKAASKAKSAAKDALATGKSKPKADAAANEKAAPAEPAKAAGNAGDSDPKTGTVEAAKPAGSVAEWPAVEVELAKARCTQLLKGIDAVAIPEPPFRKGDCGAMAPMRLISIGKNPEVSFSPPPVVSCDLIVGLTRWVKDEVQPAAKKHLGSEVIRIESMSDYSCRNAYGRARGRLSEHGRVNAIDIAGFETAKGETTMLLADWGTTQRDIRRQLAAEKAKADSAEKQRLIAEQRGQAFARASLRQGAYPEQNTTASAQETGSLPSSALGVTSGAPAGGVARNSIIDGIPRMTVSIPGGGDSAGSGSVFDTPSRLGGPKPGDTKKSIFVTTDVKQGLAVGEIRKQRFLRGAHDSACKIFGTVLGPEANNSHRNHLHLDMAHREMGVFCQ